MKTIESYEIYIGTQTIMLNKGIQFISAAVHNNRIFLNAIVSCYEYERKSYTIKVEGTNWQAHDLYEYIFINSLSYVNEIYHIFYKSPTYGG